MKKALYIIFLFYSFAFSQSKGLKISIQSQEMEPLELSCVHSPGLSNTYSVVKSWCWDEYIIDDSSGTTQEGGYIEVAATDTGTVTNFGDNQLQFYVDPSDSSNNYRSEIYVNPWPIQHAPGVEEWFGMSYIFTDDYVMDSESASLIFQNHNGVTGQTPLFAIWITDNNGSFTPGEISIVNNVTSGDVYNPTGIVPVAGQALDIVGHVVYGDDGSGLLQIWIGDVLMHDEQERTIRASHPYGGNMKWGVYKFDWVDNPTGVTESAGVGVFDAKILMGTLKILTRASGNPDIGADEIADYNLVKP